MMHLGGWGTAGTFLMTVGMLVIVAVAVAALVLLLRPVFSAGGRGNAAQNPNAGPGGYGSEQTNPFLAELEQRYARGEIDRDEFLTRKTDMLAGNFAGKRPFEK